MIIIRSATSRWVASSEASKKLGFSERTLKCLRKCGYLKPGKHWRFGFASSTAQVVYNLDLCSKEMNEWWGRDALVGP